VKHFFVMTKEQTSILLETVAFFLVTIDLYGKDRIKTFGELLQETNIIQAPIQLIYYILKRKIVWILILILEFSILSWFYFDNIGLFRPYFAHIANGEPQHSAVSYYLFFIALGFFCLNIALLFMVALVGNILLISIKPFLKLYKTEGIMLTIGAVIFFAAKLILYFHA